MNGLLLLIIIYLLELLIAVKNNFKILRIIINHEKYINCNKTSSNLKPILMFNFKNYIIYFIFICI